MRPAADLPITLIVAQLSLPYRIALGGMLVLVVLWFLVLRGGEDPVSTEPLPGEAAAAETAPAVPASAPAPAATPAAPAAVPPAEPAEVPAGDPSGPILSEVADGKVALVLFARPGATDDALVESELRRVRATRVTRHVVDVERVATYAALTVGVKVSQSPTLLVIGKGRKARAIVGLTDRREIAQAIGDIRR